MVKIASDPKQRKLFDSKPAVITGTANEAAQMQMERLEDDAVSVEVVEHSADSDSENDNYYDSDYFDSKSEKNSYLSQISNFIAPLFNDDVNVKLNCMAEHPIQPEADDTGVDLTFKASKTYYRLLSDGTKVHRR